MLKLGRVISYTSEMKKSVFQENYTARERYQKEVSGFLDVSSLLTLLLPESTYGEKEHTNDMKEYGKINQCH